MRVPGNTVRILLPAFLGGGADGAALLGNEGNTRGNEGNYQRRLWAVRQGPRCAYACLVLVSVCVGKAALGVREVG